MSSLKLRWKLQIGTTNDILLMLLQRRFDVTLNILLLLSPLPPFTQFGAGAMLLLHVVWSTIISVSNDITGSQILQRDRL
jgi:hypothetical protein